MADLTNLDISDFTSVSSVNDSDKVLLVLSDNLNGKIAVGLFKGQIQNAITPSIQDGIWYIGGISQNISAQGKTPELRAGNNGIEWKYTDSDQWAILVPYSSITLSFDDLTYDQKEQLRGYTSQFVIGNVTSGNSAQATLQQTGVATNGSPIYSLSLVLPKGDAFTYDDFTPAQIADLKKPATDAAVVALAAADNANTAADNANTSIGNLSDLTTNDKTSYVNALNEVNANKGERQVPTGLKFKAKDSSVYLRSNPINLGTSDFSIEIWGNGSAGTSIFNSLFNSVNAPVIRTPASTTYNIWGFNINNSWDYTTATAYKNVSTNICHLVLTRNGKEYKVYLNSVMLPLKDTTSLENLDFNQFIFGIEGSEFFSLGRVFNYCVDADFVKELYNGGRVDKYRLDVGYKSRKMASCNYENETCTTTGVGYKGQSPYNSNLSAFPLNKDITDVNSHIRIRAKIKMIDVSNNNPISARIAYNKGGSYMWLPNSNRTFDGEYTYYDMILSAGAFIFNQFIVIDGYNTGISTSSEIVYLEAKEYACILEYLPESIHENGVYDTSGQDNHGLFNTSGDKPIVLYSAPYQEVLTGNTAPTERPGIFCQQHINTIDGTIRIAKSTSAVGDWKKITLS